MTKPNQYVPEKEKIQYAIGVFGQNVTYGLVSQWIFYFCTDVIFIAPYLVGIIVGVSRIWDAVNDPLMGVVIDRKRFKNGEKLRPYLLKTPIMIGIVTFLLFYSPFKSQIGKVIYIFIFYIIWDILYTFQDIAQWGMTSLISPSSEERTKVIQWARIMGTLGSALAGSIPLILSYKHLLNISEKELFLVFGALFGFGGMCLSLLTYKAKERIKSQKPKEPVWKSLGLLFKNRTVILILIANILSAVTFYVPHIYFFKYKVSMTLFGYELDGYQSMILFGIATGLPGVLCMFAARHFAKLFKGMRNLLIVAAIMDVATRVAAYLIGYQGISFLFLVLVLALGGIPNNLKSIASTALWCDSLDYIELKTGKRAEAVTFAAQNLIEKAKSGLSMIMGGLTLTLIRFDATKYEAGLPQSPTFNKWIWFVFILGPAVGSVLYLIPLLFVKYNDKIKEKVELELSIKRQNAAEN
ncbi:MAG: MFS transporter [Christensenellales bacterium]